jgi:hypothetical protein
VRVAKVAPEDRSAGPLAYETHLLFSPDSRRLAVVTHESLKVIDLITGEHWKLTASDERVTSLAWTSNTDVVYAAHTYMSPPRGDDVRETASDRSFWRQRADAGPGARTLVFRESSVPAGANRHFDWPLESFCPRGDRVIFRSPLHGGTFVLLDLNSRTTRQFGSCSARSMTWWNREGTRAICSQAILDKYVIVDACTGRTSDVSDTVSAMIKRERRWRNDTTFENYVEMQGDAARAVLAAPNVETTPPIIGRSLSKR